MQVGDVVDFLGMKATIRYIGDLKDKQGTWIGAELSHPKGKYDGTFKGVKYFSCPDSPRQSGLFCLYPVPDRGNVLENN